MTLLLGLAFFLALAVVAFIHAAYGEEDNLCRCPDCGLEALSLRDDGSYACVRCGARYRRRFDGRMVPA